MTSHGPSKAELVEANTKNKKDNYSYLDLSRI